jgi:hypothetical protein
VYQGSKSASFSSESGFSSRGAAEKKQGQKTLFGRGAHNVFRVLLDKHFEKHELIVHFEVIFDKLRI